MQSLSDTVRQYRMNKMRGFMRAHALQALAFTAADWFEWAGNHSPSELSWERPYLLVVPLEGEAVAFMSEHGRHRLAAERERGSLWISEVTHYAEAPPGTRRPWVATQWSDMVKQGLRRIGLSGAAIGTDDLGAALQSVEKAEPSVRWRKVGGELRQLRRVKHPEEIAVMRTAASLSDWAMDVYRTELHAGCLLAEVDYIVSARLAAEAARRLPGANFIIQRLLTLSGRASACPHGDGSGPGQVLQKDTIANTVVATKLNGLAMELSRPWLVGRHDAEVVAMLEATRSAQAAAIAAAVPGRPMAGIHGAAHAALERARLGDELVLRAGHGIGVVMHDHPADMPVNEDPLLAGEVFAIEPGLYLPHLGGFRYADTVLVGAGAPESLTRSSKAREALSLP